MDWFLYDNVLRHKRVKRRNWLQIESRFQKKKKIVPESFSIIRGIILT